MYVCIFSLGRYTGNWLAVVAAREGNSALGEWGRSETYFSVHTYVWWFFFVCVCGGFNTWPRNFLRGGIYVLSCSI